MTGQTAALLLARAGHRVTLLDRDTEPPPSDAESAWTDWDRPGVNQFRQPHLMLPRWHHEMARELPDLLTDLVDGGGAQVNLLHLQPASVTHGWHSGDEQFQTVTARRPVLEAALGRLSQAERLITVRRGVRVTGLLISWDKSCPRVRGVRTTAGQVHADLVVDATGRRTPVAGWVRALGALPVEHAADCGFVYYSRHYRASRGVLPSAQSSVLTHFPSLSLLTLPCDLGTYCLVLTTSSQDHELRALRHVDAWEAVAACLPPARPWLRGGVPITEVNPLAGLHDVRRSYFRDDRPVVTGLVAIGDAAAATNPSLGRGATLGVLDACALRDTLAQGSQHPHELVHLFNDIVTDRVAPWHELTASFDRHRLGELNADIRAIPYSTEDTTWPVTTSLINGATHDPVLARASSQIAGMLATPTQVFSDPDVFGRVCAFSEAPRYPLDGPTRADLLAAIHGAPVHARRTSRQCLTAATDQPHRYTPAERTTP